MVSVKTLATLATAFAGITLAAPTGEDTTSQGINALENRQAGCAYDTFEVYNDASCNTADDPWIITCPGGYADSSAAQPGQCVNFDLSFGIPESSASTASSNAALGYTLSVFAGLNCEILAWTDSGDAGCHKGSTPGLGYSDGASFMINGPPPAKRDADEVAEEVETRDVTEIEEIEARQDFNYAFDLYSNTNCSTKDVHYRMDTTNANINACTYIPDGFTETACLRSDISVGAPGYQLQMFANPDCIGPIYLDKGNTGQCVGTEIEKCALSLQITGPQPHD